MKRYFILILAAALCLSGCGKQEKEASAQIFAMDTVMEIAAFGPQAEEAVSETESQIQELEKQLSRTLPDSDVSRINRNGTTPTTGIAAGTWALLEAALEYRDATDGAFDITIAPVMDAWGFTGDSFRVPEQAELDALLKYVKSGALAAMKGVRVRGVMGIATYTSNEFRVRLDFELLQQYKKELEAYFDSSFDTLSMGMSDDYPLALDYGTTMVRIGSLIFGKRDYAAAEKEATV